MRLQYIGDHASGSVACDSLVGACPDLSPHLDLAVKLDAAVLDVEDPVRNHCKHAGSEVSDSMRVSLAAQMREGVVYQCQQLGVTVKQIRQLEATVGHCR